ncbi:MAG TPA: O-antigen ligase family protein [Flavisolibacter sp.]|nr:O-antigen ligase family protein [Flavisolibacter sp.]
MTASTNRILTWLLSLALLYACWQAAYLQEFYYLLLPLTLLLGICLVHYPVYLFYLLVFSIPWSIEFNFSQNLGTDFPDEPLMLLMSFSMLGYLIWNRRTIRARHLHPLLFILFLQLVWTLCTLAASTEPLYSFKFILAKTWYLLAFVAAPLVLFRDEKVLKRSALLLLFSMSCVTLIGLLRHGQKGWSFDTINESLLPFFRNHVSYSALLVFMVPLLILVIKRVNGRWARSLLYILFFVTLVALYFSYARGAWLALVFGLLSYWLIRKKLLVASFCLAIALSAAAVFWISENYRYMRLAPDFRTTIYHSDFREHLVATYELKDVSTAERVHRWVAGIRMAEDTWMAGTGPASFYWNYKPYTLPAFRTWVSRNEEQSTVHNYFLLLLIEQGLPALLLFVLLLATAFFYVQCISQRKGDPFWTSAAVTAGVILVMECTVNFLSDLVETDKAGSVFYICLAVIIIADWKTVKRSDPPSYVQRIS